MMAGFLALISNPDLETLRCPLFHFRLRHNVFARHANLIFPFMVAGVLINHRMMRILFGVLVLFSVLVLLLNISRGGWVALFTTIALWIVFLVKKDKKFLPPVAIGCFSVLLLLSSLWFFSPVFKARAISTLEHAKTLTGRTRIWPIYIAAIKESPVVGWGYGIKITPLVVAKGTFEGAKKNQKEYLSDLKAHNLVLDIFFHQGLIGLFFFSLFFGTILFYIVKTVWFTGEGKERLFFYAILCSFVSVFMVHGLIEVISFKLIGFIAGLTAGESTW